MCVTAKKRETLPGWLVPVLLGILGLLTWVTVSAWQEGNWLLFAVAVPVLLVVAAFTWLGMKIRRWERHPDEVPAYLRDWWNA
jgi:uncharacterized membrane protein